MPYGAGGACSPRLPAGRQTLLICARGGGVGGLWILLIPAKGDAKIHIWQTNGTRMGELCLEDGW